MSRRTGTPVSYADEHEPRVTPDGMTWVDQDGNPPELDKEGRLRAPFVVVGRFRTERWGIGTRLPLTPARSAALATAVAATRPAGSDNGALPDNTKENDMSAAGTKATKTKSVTHPVPKPGKGKKKASTSKPTLSAKERANRVIPGSGDLIEKALQAQASKKGKRIAGAHPHSAGGALEDLKGASPSSTNGAVKQEHPTTDHLDKAKREGVRVATASRGGFHVIVFGTLNRALKGVFPEASQAKAAAVAAGLDVKGMPK